MALIETNFIRPQEVYDRNTGESKVRYRSYDGIDRFIPVVEGENGVPKTLVEVTHAELKAMRDAGKLTPGALYRITDYNCTTTQENTQSAGHQFDIVLLALSANKLAEEGWAMMNENIYDVTFADDVTKKCWIYEDKSSGLVYITDISTMLCINDAATSDVEIDEENKTAICSNYESTELTSENPVYNYFQNSNLSAWKVWYCLDNDKSRFAWADDSVDGGNLASITINGLVPDRAYLRDVSNDTILADINAYAWTCTYTIMGNEGVDTIYTNSETPQIGDKTWHPRSQSFTGSEITSYTPAHEGTGLPNGRGVIYRLIDEWMNDVAYDFKNIQFKRTITNGQYDEKGENTWCYTLNVWYNDMCQDASIVGNTLLNDEGYINGVHDNKFGYATDYDLFIQGVGTLAFALGDNVVLSFDDGGFFGIYSNTIGNSFYSNTIGNSFYGNTIGNSFYSNTIGNIITSNTIGNGFFSNTIGNFFTGNMIGNSFYNKTISDNTSDKNYGNNGVELATKS